MSQCKECGSTEHYNFELNIGLCNPCIGRRLERLQSENERLKEAINTIPTVEYHNALREGLDANAAWDCFIEAIDEWKKEALKETKQ